MSPTGNMGYVSNMSSTTNISFAGNISSPGNTTSVNSPSSSIGGAVTSGIQDISALATLLGSQQCEEHVASSLVGGFLYASATSLSIFGSLGIVSAGLKALVASFAFPSRGEKGMGAKWLNDMGLSPTGKMLSQIMWEENCHVGQTKLDKKLEQLHISDVSKLLVDATYTLWNVLLYYTSAGAMVFGITPYLYLIMPDINNWLPSRWLLSIFFPLARCFGSITVSNTVQSIIQIQHLAIIKHRLIFLTVDADVRRLFQDKGPPNWWDAQFSSEVALSRLETHLKEHISTSSVQNNNTTTSLLQVLDREKKKHFSSRYDHFSMLLLVSAQLTITFGLLLTLVGYIGALTLCRATTPNSGP